MRLNPGLVVDKLLTVGQRPMEAAYGFRSMESLGRVSKVIARVEHDSYRRTLAAAGQLPMASLGRVSRVFAHLERALFGKM